MDWLATVVLAVLGIGALWVTAAGITVWVAARRGGAPLKWGLLGLLLGPLGVALALRLVRPCPNCSAPVLREVRTCPICGADIPRMDPGDNPIGPLWSYRKDW